MCKEQQDAIAQAVRDAAQLILAGLCAIGEAIHESKEVKPEPGSEEARPPVRECTGVTRARYGGLCASTTCFDPPVFAQCEATDNCGEVWYLCSTCVEHMVQRGYDLTLAKRKGIPPKPDMSSLVRLRRKQEAS